MAKIDKMAPFVYANMPQDQPGSLTVAQAYDVSAFVLSHRRPKFNGDALVGWPPPREDILTTKRSARPF